MARYEDREWLNHHINEMGKPFSQIADICGVEEETIREYYDDFGLGEDESDDEEELEEETEEILEEMEESPFSDE